MTPYEQKLQELEEARQMAEKRIPYILIAGLILGLLLCVVVQKQKVSVNNSPYTETGEPKIGWGWWA